MNPIFENIFLGIVALLLGGCVIGLVVTLGALIVCLIKDLIKFK